MRRLLALIATAILALAFATAAPATTSVAAPAAFPTISGVAVNWIPVDPTCTEKCGPAPTLGLTMTTARSLTITCAGTGGLMVINGTTTPADCDDLQSFRLAGSAGADTVSLDLTRGYFPVVTDLGAGNDVFTVKSRSESYVLGGDGNDRLSGLLYLPARGTTPYVTTGLYGGAGTDTLTNLGYGPGTRPANPLDYAAILRGDGGVDTVYGHGERADDITAEWIDKITFSSGPGRVTLTVGAQADKVSVALNGNYGPTVKITSGSTTRSFVIPTRTARLAVLTGLGNDDITVDHRSSHTEVYVDAGGGSDKVTVLPSLAYQQYASSVVQPEPWKTIEWAGAESVTVRRVARP